MADLRIAVPTQGGVKTGGQRAVICRPGPAGSIGVNQGIELWRRDAPFYYRKKEAVTMHIGGIDNYGEINALNAAKVPGETKRMAALLLKLGHASSADEAIIQAQENRGVASFKEALERAKSGNL